MLSRSHFILLLLITINLRAQDAKVDQPATLHIGDPAPPLRLGEWLKGKPFQNFAKGQVYVVEFWATWCAPCRAQIPRLTSLARKYKGKLTILGVDLLGQEIISLQKVKAFVDSMGNRMNYDVAAEDSNFMSTTWIDATGRQGIPRSFVIDREGRIAWMGHPFYLDNVLPGIVNNRWDIQKAAAQLVFDRYLDSLDMEAQYRLIPYRNKPDMTLFAINSMVVGEPALKYAPRVAYQTFAALLKTDTRKACEYGRKVIVTPTYEVPAVDAIINVIAAYADSLNLPPEVYDLGAEACQVFINWIPYPENFSMHKEYSRMANWYARANKRSKAIKAQQKAIEELKRKNAFAAGELQELELKLSQYRNM
jgi:thiol-disulfide isomerase/thioredoxin